MKNEKHIILFDGDCGICNHTRLWIQKNDKFNKFEIHPYQTFDYQSYSLKESEVSASVYLIKNKKKYCKSNAVFEILKDLPFPWSIIGRLLSNRVAVFLSNPIYNSIARNRSKISDLMGLNACKL